MTLALLAAKRYAQFGAAFVLGLSLLAYAPDAYACSVCNLQPASSTINGTTYYYLAGGCTNPPNNSWGDEDCHTEYEVIADSLQAVVECDTSGSSCYYTEVSGGGGGGTGWGDDGGGHRNDDGSCPPWYSTCL